MLIAALLAIVLHVGLMQIKFSSGPVHMPSVSLPRSVNILLRGTTPNISTIRQVLAEQKTDHREKAYQEKMMPFQPHKTPSPPTTRNMPVIEQPQAALSKEYLRKPSDTVQEKSNDALKGRKPLSSEKNTAGIPAAKESPLAEKFSHSAEKTLTGDEGEGGAAAPGALQMAYPRYQLNNPPPYPFLARKRNQQGTVILQVLVNGDGRVDDLTVDVSSGFSMLDRAAIAAVREWVFEPGKKGNLSIPMRVKVPVIFKLKN